METPKLNSHIFKKLLLENSSQTIHEFDQGTMHNINLSSEDYRLQGKFVEYNTNQGVASREELEIYFDETWTSDFEFIETYFADEVSHKLLIQNKVNGSALNLYLMSIGDLYWTFYTLNGMEFWDVLFKGGKLNDITSIIIWLYLSDKKPDGYRKVANFLKPHPANVGETELKLHPSLKNNYATELTEQSPIDPDFTL